jgi:hypothetical protein
MVESGADPCLLDAMVRLKFPEVIRTHFVACIQRTTNSEQRTTNDEQRTANCARFQELILASECSLLIFCDFALEIRNALIIFLGYYTNPELRSYITKLLISTSI